MQLSSYIKFNGELSKKKDYSRQTFLKIDVDIGVENLKLILFTCFHGRITKNKLLNFFFSESFAIIYRSYYNFKIMVMAICSSLSFFSNCNPPLCSFIRSWLEYTSKEYSVRIVLPHLHQVLKTSRINFVRFFRSWLEYSSKEYSARIAGLTLINDAQRRFPGIVQVHKFYRVLVHKLWYKCTQLCCTVQCTVDSYINYTYCTGTSISVQFGGNRPLAPSSSGSGAQLS